MNTASYVYIPPPNFRDTSFFVDNLKKFPPSGRMIIMSDHNYKREFPDYEHTILTIPPERLDAAKMNPQCGISNALFIAAMRDAKKRGIEHVLYLESDCRMGTQGFDVTLFTEFFTFPFPLIAAGTIMAWNVFNGGTAWVERWKKLVTATIDYATPVHCYGSFPFKDYYGANRPCNPTIFPNGAGCIVSVEWMWELFNGFKNLVAIATGDGTEGKAWDWQIGERARLRFGADVFELFGHLKYVNSCYGDLTMSNEERLNLLKTGKVVVGHQFKGKEVI